MVDGLRRAFGFLTVYPLRASDAWTPETLGSSMVYYPLVGTCIGLALWALTRARASTAPAIAGIGSGPDPFYDPLRAAYNHWLANQYRTGQPFFDVASTPWDSPEYWGRFP